MTSALDDTREGEGRAQPGPSSSLSSRSARRASRQSAGGGAGAVLGGIVLVLASAAASVFGTQAHQYSSPGALAAVAAFGSFLGVLVALGMSKAPSGGVAQWLAPLLAGAGAFALAPWLVMANRYTDAPPGSEVVFFTTAAWGALLALALAIGARDRITRTGGALLALAGAAALVANWERPSSFSPLVRFAAEELVMLLAGALWVALVLVLVRAARRGTLRRAALVAGLGGVGAAVVLVAIGVIGGTVSRADVGGAGFWAFGIATAFATAGTLSVLKSGSARGVALAYLLVPVSISALGMLEQRFSPLGPQPIVLLPALGSAACVAAGAFVSLGPDVPGSWRRRSWLGYAALAIAALALVTAAVSLAMPTLTAAVSGLRTDGSLFEATFRLYGYETAGPWLAVGLALAAFGMALGPSPVRAAWLRALALGAAGAAFAVAAATPLKTLAAFVPSDVQVDYGSEFARIGFSGTTGAWAIAAVGGALVAIGLTLFLRPDAPSPREAAEVEFDDREVVAREEDPGDRARDRAAGADAGADGGLQAHRHREDRRDRPVYRRRDHRGQHRGDRGT